MRCQLSVLFSGLKKFLKVKVPRVRRNYLKGSTTEKRLKNTTLKLLRLLASWIRQQVFLFVLWLNDISSSIYP